MKQLARINPGSDPSFACFQQREVGVIVGIGIMDLVIYTITGSDFFTGIVFLK